MVTATQKAYEELQKNLGNAPSTPTQTPGVQGAPSQKQQKPKFYAPIPNEPGPAIQINPQQNSVWNDPANLIGLWTEMRAKDTTVSDPVLKDIKTIIDYYRAKNPGKQWYELEGLSPDDPMAGIFSSMAIPMPGQPATIPVIQPPESIATGNLWDPAQATSAAIDATLWADGENLPDWQKWAMGLFSQPAWIQGAAQATPWAILGAIAGAGIGTAVAPGIGTAGGAQLGATIGGMVTPLAAGGLIGYFGDPETYNKMREQGVDPVHVEKLENIFRKGLAGTLMWFGEAAEQYVGTFAQAGQAVYESAPALPDVLRAMFTGDEMAKADAALKLGPMADIINDLPAVIEAARLSYEALETSLPVVGNIPAALEMGAEKIGDVFTSGVRGIDEAPDVSPTFAKPGQVHILGQPEPITLDAKGMAVLKMIREDIKANPNTPAMQIVQAYQEELGFSGTAADMFYQSVLDPLNFVEAGSGIILGRRAGAKGLAGEIGRGPTKTSKVVGDLIRAQIDGVPDMTAMSKLDLELAKLTPEGQLADLQKPLQTKEFFNWMTELDPPSKAKASLDMLQENQQIMFELTNDIPEMDIAVEAWGMGNTATNVKAINSLVGLPEMKHLREFMLQFGDTDYKKIRALWAADDNLGYRAFVKKVADGLKIDQHKVLADIMAGDAKVLLDRFKKTLTGDAATAVDGLTVRDITAMQDYFKKSPLTFKEFRIQVQDAASASFEKWAVKHYDLKPPALPIRLAHMLKAVQSVLVLAFNPGYATQNIVDGFVRMRTEGISIATLPGSINKYWGPDGFDIKPSRVDEGYGMIGVDPFSKKGAITSAMRSKGIIQGITDTARKIGEYAPATKAASITERTQTRIAKYGNHKKVWSHLWNKNTVPVPDAIRTGLSTMGAQAGKAFDTVIATAKKASDLELDNVLRKLDDDFTYKRADNYIGDVATELGVDTQMATSLLEQSGALDYLNDRLAQGDSMASAKNATRKMFDDFIHDAFKDDVKTRAKQSEARVKVEGWSAVLDLFSDMGQALDERVTRHSAGWTESWDAFEQVRRNDYNAASGLIDSYMRQTNAEWTRLKEWRASTWEGALKGLGFADEANLTPDARAVMKPLRDTDAIWDTFFTESSKMWDEHGAIAKDLTSAELKLRRTEIQTKIAEMYADTSAKELANMREMGDAFTVMWQNQGLPGIDAAKAWWDSMATLTEKRQKFMTDMRNYERGEKVVTPEMKALLKDGGSKKKMWPLFYEKVLLPLYAETIKANDDGIKNVVNAAKKDGGPAKPVPPDARLLHRLQEQAKIEHDNHVAKNPDARLTDMEIDRLVDEGWTGGKKRLFNAVNKDKRVAGLPPYKTMGDVPMVEALKSMRDRIVNGDVPETPVVEKPVAKIDPVEQASYDQQLKQYNDEIVTYEQQRKQYEADIASYEQELKNYKAELDAFNNKPAEQTGGQPKAVTDFAYKVAEEILYKGVGEDSMISSFGSTDPLDIVTRANADRAVGMGYPKSIDGMIKFALDRIETSIKTSDEWSKKYYSGILSNLEELKRLGYVEGAAVGTPITAGTPPAKPAKPAITEPTKPTIKKPIEPKAKIVEPAKVAQPVPETPAMGPSVPGTVDKVAPVSYVSEVFDQGVGNFIDPLLNGMVEKWQGDITKIDTKNLDPETLRAMKSYLADAQAEFSKRKLASMKITDTLTEDMLLNYSKKYNFDTFMDAAFPYQFWYTRTMLNWGNRMIDKPQIFSQYYRLLTNLQNDDEDSNMPYRMRGKIAIPAKWLPDEYGNSIFVDPWRYLFSFHQMNNAIDQMAQDNNQLNRKAESILYDMVKDELITTEQRKEAMADKKSELWLSAYEQAKGDEGKDFMSMVSLAMQPALYLDMPWKLFSTNADGTSRANEISELPGTRFLQGLTGLTGTDFTKADFLGKAMYGIGVKEFGEWGDYSIKSQLAWMVFEGKIDVEEAEVAMVDKQGPAWDEARMRVMETITLKQPGLMSAMAFREKGLDVALATSLISWLPATLLPQGEIIMRGLKDDYDKAWDDYNSGNLDAIDTFYEDHPEWKIRTPLYMDDQQEMLRRLMYNNITDAYYGLPVKLRDQVNEELGDDFVTKLIDNETRDIDAVDMETLATWSRRLGGYAPKDAQGELIRFEDEAGAQLYQNYMDAMKEAFPEKKFMDDYLYSLPEAQQKTARANMPKYQEIWDWQKQYAVDNPEIIPYIMREGDKMFGQSPELILKQYKLEVEEKKLFPELAAYKKQLGWDNLTDAQKSVMYDTDPLLRESSSWRSSYLMEHPELIEFNISDNSKIKGLAPELQQAYYLFYSERDRLYPNITKTWEDMYALPSGGQRSAFYNAHPELKEYSDWKKSFYEMYPKLENVIKPPEGEYKQEYSKEYMPKIDLKELPPYVVTSMYDYYTTDDNLSTGASAYLRYYWEQQGKPMGAFTLWIDSIEWMFTGY